MPARRRDAGDFNLSSAEQKQAIDLLTRLLSTPQGRTLAAVLVIIGVLIWGGYWVWQHHAPALATGPTIRVATWNMHVFAPRPAIHLDTIAGIIRSSNFDVIALQEIRENGEEVNALLDTLGSPWRRSEFSRITGNHERFVFIFNASHVQEIGSAHMIDADTAFSFNRIPYEDEFKAGNFDFTLITCHLYYGDNTAGHEQRSREAKMLADFAKQEVDVKKQKDVIVLGDFNETFGLENLHFFTDLGWKELNHDPSNLHSNEVYDNLLIDPRQTNEWNGTSGSIHFDESIFHHDDKEAVEQVSDHRPAYADFVTTMTAAH